MIKSYVRRFKSLLVFGTALAIILTLGGLSGEKAQARFHTDAELTRLQDMLQNQPYDTNHYFATGGRCGGCHGHDPNHISLITHDSVDVNIMDDWQGTMMANSAKDPLWRAKVSHEILVNPGLQAEIEDKCTRCHAPAGRFEAHFLGAPYYGISDLVNDTFGLDGVNCTACHEQKDTLLGHNYSGDLQFGKHYEYGPIQNPVSAVMEFFVGFQVDYGQHVKQAAFCGGCHTLLTQTTDLSGNLTGNDFVEQATYPEWTNSSYAANGITCQHCHIPEINDTIRLATDYPWVPGRSPYGEHHLVGGNAFMLKLMQNNMSACGITCNSWNFDTTIDRTTRYLRDSTLHMNVVQTARTIDTVFYDVDLQNKAGHKFPSGYPSRIAWIQFVVTDNLGDTLYQSGMQDANGDIIGRDPVFEPHHNVCYTNNDVQIYEMVMGDVNNNPTTVLERADTSLKDNRIPPLGFTTSHPSYDTMRIIGTNGDPDFNYSGPTEGTGGDVTHYHVALNGYTGPLNLTCTVYYASVPRLWLSELFSYNSTEIGAFQTMYNNADHTPMTVATVTMVNTITQADQTASGVAVPEILVYPNPSVDGKIRLSGWENAKLKTIHVYDVTGKEVMNPIDPRLFNGEITLPNRGVYLIVMDTESKQRIVKKVIW